jgi:hypothetical protein
VLGTAEHPGFLERFVLASERHLPERRFVDMAYPACWWTGRDGVNVKNLQACFASLGKA